MKLYAVVRIRGTMNIFSKIKDTMKLINIPKSNYCSLVKESQLGMLKKAKDYITWGEINKETLIALLKKRGRLIGDRLITEEYLSKKKLTFEQLADKLMTGEIKLKDLGIKPYFRLHPPKKGFERGGIKKPFNVGGALGYRGDKICTLIRKMI